MFGFNCDEERALGTWEGVELATLSPVSAILPSVTLIPCPPLNKLAKLIFVVPLSVEPAGALLEIPGRGLPVTGPELCMLAAGEFTTELLMFSEVGLFCDTNVFTMSTGLWLGTAGGLWPGTGEKFELLSAPAV
jgi:hypothetical protein